MGMNGPAYKIHDVVSNAKLTDELIEPVIASP